MIAIENLVKRHGTRGVFHSVNLEARSGRVTGFVRPNGAGKSSTLRRLLGLDRAGGGRAPIGGCTYRELHGPLCTMGAMSDDSDARPSRAAHGHLGWVASGAGINRCRVAEVLSVVELNGAAGRRVCASSLEMRQRLGLAATLLGDPGVLVLDEPVNGLDPEEIRQIRRLLRQRTDAGGMVLLSSHVLAELTETADDVVVITGGRVWMTGILEEVAAGYVNLKETFFPLTAPAGGAAGGGAGQAGRIG